MGEFKTEFKIDHITVHVYFQNYDKATNFPQDFQLEVQDHQGGYGRGFLYFRDGDWSVVPNSKAPGIINEIAQQIIERLILYFQ